MISIIHWRSFLQTGLSDFNCYDQFLYNNIILYPALKISRNTYRNTYQNTLTKKIFYIKNLLKFKNNHCRKTATGTIDPAMQRMSVFVVFCNF